MSKELLNELETLRQCEYNSPNNKIKELDFKNDVQEVIENINKTIINQEHPENSELIKKYVTACLIGKPIILDNSVEEVNNEIQIQQIT